LRTSYTCSEHQQPSASTSKIAPAAQNQHPHAQDVATKQLSAVTSETTPAAVSTTAVLLRHFSCPNNDQQPATTIRKSKARQSTAKHGKARQEGEEHGLNNSTTTQQQLNNNNNSTTTTPQQQLHN